jgi:alkyl hydroperoxide reductase subunit AhpC
MTTTAHGLRLGDEAPDFTAETTEGRLSFHDWLGDSWGVLFSHPKDFTPVCTTELGEMARIKGEFERRRVAHLYGMIHPNDDATVTVRSVFVIGPDKKIKLMITYPQSTGRDFQEVLRVLDSVQLTARHQVSTPANWRQGEDVIIIPAVSDEEAQERFPDGWKTVKPYLRMVPQPQG